MSVLRPIEAAKAAVPVLELAERLSGAQGVKRGRELAFVCPFHDDHDPSLLVDPKKQVWHCFPCGTGGDVVRLAQLAGDYPDDGPGAATAAAYLLLEFGYDVPQRPRSWYAKQERQGPIRNAVEDARIEALMRRLWRWIFEPILADLDDPDERARVGNELWTTVRPLAVRLVEDRRETA